MHGMNAAVMVQYLLLLPGLFCLGNANPGVLVYFLVPLEKTEHPDASHTSTHSFCY